MHSLKEIYSSSLSLLTDLYQLTMAYGYWVKGMEEQEAVFNLFFRKSPFKGGYAIASGLEYVIEFLKELKFEASDLEYLSTLQGNDGKPLFEQGFLDYLRNIEFSLSLEAVPEGTVVFPHEPLIRVTGPLLQCQLIETSLLNLINFQTLIATKASRISMAAQGEPVLEFGLRRAQGIDGALAASRAAYIGGVSATSNVLAGKLFGVPVKGTHAHSWVMSFDSESESFQAYADAMPNNCVFLVDTYDTLEGVRKAVEAGKKLRAKGHEMVGIRLDSGDLSYLSIEARKILDEGGFPNASIVASNDLDEYTIESLKSQGATIAVWGVGTRLATAYDQPALGGVYKLSAIRSNGEWLHKVKLSEQLIKVSIPGNLQVRRFFDKNGDTIADAIYDSWFGVPKRPLIVDPMDPMKRKYVDSDSYEDLLVPVFVDGDCVYEIPTLSEIRERAAKQLARFHRGVKRFQNPHRYVVGLEKKLHDLRERLVLEARGHLEIL